MFWLLIGVVLVIIAVLICAKWGDKMYDSVHKVTDNFTSTESDSDSEEKEKDKVE